MYFQIVGTILEAISLLVQKVGCWCNITLAPPRKFGFLGHLGRCTNVYIRITNVYKRNNNHWYHFGSHKSTVQKVGCWCNVTLAPPRKFGFLGHLGGCTNVYIRITNVYKWNNNCWYIFFLNFEYGGANLTDLTFWQLVFESQSKENLIAAYLVLTSWFIDYINYNVIKYCNSWDITISFNNINYRVNGIYRSPSYIVDLFLDSLESFLNINNNSELHYIRGDIDINILSNNSIITNYLNIMSKYIFSLV
jgi:hypothetical protein